MTLLEKYLESWQEDQNPREDRPGKGLSFPKWLSQNEEGLTEIKMQRLLVAYKKDPLTVEQKKWLEVLKKLRATVRTIPRTSDGDGLRENLNQFFDECYWEDKLPRKYLR